MKIRSDRIVKTPYAPDSSQPFGLLASAIRPRSLNKRINGFGLKPFTQSLLRNPSFIRKTL
jgi:hypothetical protein